MDAARFQVQFPEFAQVDGNIIQAKLNEAAARMGGPDARIWGSFAVGTDPLNFTDIAQGNLAAYYLITSPFGFETRMSEQDAKKSPYWMKWEECMYAVAGGVTVGAGAPLVRPWWC